MKNNSIELPIIIQGKPIYPSLERDNYILSYESGLQFLIPKINEADIEVLREAPRYQLHELHIQEIISFLLSVGRFWLPDNLDHPLYQKAVNYLTYVNGYDFKMAQRELNLISACCAIQGALFDLLDAELGSYLYLEEWLNRGDALVHAEPVGNILHILVGNVPVSTIMSVIRSIITKNQTLGKLPRRDPITTLFFALSMIELAPDHPVSKSMNVLYWPGGDPIEDQIFPLANTICVWGGSTAVKEVRAKVGGGIDILEFGPKISFAVIGKESATLKKVALDLAHDISLYDQQACFSPRMAFVEGDYQTFITNLSKGLEIYKSLLPKAKGTLDNHAHISRTRLEAIYNQNTVLKTEDTEWTITVINNISEITEHPLGRFIYIIPVKHISECLPYVNPNIQTITISPWHRNSEIRDRATLQGAAKLTEVGLIEAVRIGSTHDNIYPMQRMVRWVCVERGCDHWGKYIEQGPVDSTLWLMKNANQLEKIQLD